MAALKIHYDGWLKLSAGLLRALGAKAGDTLEVSPREDGLVLRTADKKGIPREPQLSDPAPAEPAIGGMPPPSGVARRTRTKEPAKTSVALPPALRGAGRRRKAVAPDEPAG